MELHHKAAIRRQSEPEAVINETCLRLNAHRTVQWPKRIEGLAVEGVDTVAGSPSSAERAGIPGQGIWLRVRVAGLGHLCFD